jgi:hypothetical protein
METLAALMLLMADPSDVEVLRRSAPALLDEQTAAEHLASARAAAGETGVRPELLLAVAWHESRYVSNAVTREPGHRVSCGVMTPEPTHYCKRKSLPRQYLDGAKHLAMYLSVYGTETKALRAYVGGGVLVRTCARRGRFRNARGTDICDVRAMFVGRADQLRSAWASSRVASN